jgi:C4-dicarboxylate transporter DctQ subunit
LKTKDFVFKVLNNIEEIILTITFSLLVVACFTQVICRFVLNISIPWLEEFMRAMFVWATAVGISCAYKLKSHLGVDAVVNLFPAKGKKVAALIAYLLSLAFCVIMIKYGMRVTLRHIVSNQISISMGTPIYLISIAIPIGFAMTFARIVQTIIKDYFINKNKSGESGESHISEGLL